MKFSIEVDWQLYQTELTRFYEDPANTWLLQKTILVLMRGDRGCSQLWGHSNFRNDKFIGQTIHACVMTLENEKTPRKSLC